MDKGQGSVFFKTHFYMSDRMIQIQFLKKGGEKLCGFYG